MELISKRDIIIPKGTVFKRMDGMNIHYKYDNYEHVFALDKDTCAVVTVSSENKEYFDTKEKMNEQNN